MLCFFKNNEGKFYLYLPNHTAFSKNSTASIIDDISFIIDFYLLILKSENLIKILIELFNENKYTYF